MKPKTKKKVVLNCHFCNKKFNSYRWETTFEHLPATVIHSCYCSKICEKKHKLAIKKALRGEELTKAEKTSIKNVRYAIV